MSVSLVAPGMIADRVRPLLRLPHLRQGPFLAQHEEAIAEGGMWTSGNPNPPP